MESIPRPAKTKETQQKVPMFDGCHRSGSVWVGRPALLRSGGAGDLFGLGGRGGGDLAMFPSRGASKWAPRNPRTGIWNANA